MSEQPSKDESKNEPKPSFITYLFVIFFSILIGLLAKKKLKEWCKREGLTEKEGCAVLFIVIWIIGAAAMLLSYILYILSLIL